MDTAGHMKRLGTRRIGILYLFLVILIGASVPSLWFYGSKMISKNREYLEIQEKDLQTTTSRGLAREISLYADNLQQRLKEFFGSVLPLATEIEGAKYGSDPRLRKTLEQFITESPAVVYATVLNSEARGVQAGEYNAAGDAFLRKALEAAFIASRQSTLYQSNPIAIVRNNRSEPVMIYARPIIVKNEFRGMVAAVVTFAALLDPLEDIHRAGREAFIVDNAGRLVAYNIPDKNVPGKEMFGSPIVQKFLAWRGAAQATETTSFQLMEGNETIQMLGTYSPVPSVNWGVMVQRKTRDAYLTVDEMRSDTMRWGIVVIILSLVIAVVAAKSITRPLDVLTRTAHAMAQGDFTQETRVDSVIREVSEVAEALNLANEQVQRYVSDLKLASEEKRNLFLESIDALAAAVDARDPYTRGHARRVSQYSVVIARQIGLPDDEVEKIQISATLHDIGKIGIRDSVLLKPGVLTNDEFEIMKRHTVMGFEIVRQIRRLQDMLPGIRWHHEALNGKGYPDAISGDELPLMVRIIAVADTFDAVTTDRPYQAGRDFPQTLEILRKHAGTKYDPIVVDAMHSAYAKGELKEFEVRRQTIAPVTQPVA